MRVSTWLRRIGLAVLGLVVTALAVAGFARLGDGPLAMLPGGAFASGEWVDAPVDDWSFAADIAEIEFELDGESTSRTAWILVEGGKAWIPCSLSFPPFKRWHERALANGRAVLRIDGKRYPVTLTRDEDAETGRRLRAIAQAKYANLPSTEAGVWVFRVASRAR